MNHNVLSVSQLNEQIRVIVDSEPSLASVAVLGEISNYKKYPSGHHYFTLKDESSSLKCVMFKSSAYCLSRTALNAVCTAFAFIFIKSH